MRCGHAALSRLPLRSCVLMLGNRGARRAALFPTFRRMHHSVSPLRGPPAYASAPARLLQNLPDPKPARTALIAAFPPARAFSLRCRRAAPPAVRLPWDAPRYSFT